DFRQGHRLFLLGKQPRSDEFIRHVTKKFVTTWLVFILSGRRSLRHERLPCSSSVWNLRRARQRAWRLDVFLASASTLGQVYWRADALCYYSAHQHTQQGSDYRFDR